MYAGLDTTTGELLAISEWSVKLLPGQGQALSPRIQSTAKKKVESPTHAVVAHYDLSMCLKQIASIEQEMSFLMKLNHANLVHYVNMKYVQENDTLVVYLLQEFVLGKFQFNHRNANIALIIWCYFLVQKDKFNPRIALINSV